MTLKKFAVTFALGSMALLTAGATASTAQSHVNSPDPLLGTPSVATETSHIDGITGHAEDGKHAVPAFLHRLPRTRRQRPRHERAMD